MKESVTLVKVMIEKFKRKKQVKRKKPTNRDCAMRQKFDEGNNYPYSRAQGKGLPCFRHGRRRWAFSVSPTGVGEGHSMLPPWVYGACLGIAVEHCLLSLWV